MHIDWRSLATIVGVVPTANWLAACLATLLVLVCVRGFNRLRATTLAAPCLWAALSAGCLATVSLVESRFSGIGLSALRFAAAATTLCPLMAVLGAKRPQDRGWQWVVLTLWIILVWPAAQAVLLPAGVRLELFIAWKLFLWGLICVGLLNYLPTRHWLAALLVAVGQGLLLHEHLGLGSWSSATWPLASGIGCLLAAAGLICRPQNASSSSPALSDFDAQWRGFRDGFGAFWALRVLGRVNQAAELRDWPLRLHWHGFVAEKRPPTEQQLAELEQTLSTLLRRFVATEDS